MEDNSLNRSLYQPKSKITNQNYVVIIQANKSCNPPWNSIVSCYYSYLYGIIKLPYELVILCLVSIFGWIAHIGFLFFFSDYMGQFIFKGSNDEAFNSSSHIAYLDGVKMSSLALIGSNVVGIIYIIILERWLLKRIGKYYQPVFVSPSTIVITVLYSYKNFR